MLINFKFLKTIDGTVKGSVFAQAFRFFFNRFNSRAKAHHGSWLVSRLKSICFMYEQRMDQPGKIANPARGQLNREENVSPPLFSLAP